MESEESSGPAYLRVAALTRGWRSGPGGGAVSGAAGGLGPGYGQRLGGSGPVGGRGGAMLLVVSVLVLLDLVVARSAAAREQRGKKTDPSAACAGGFCFLKSGPGGFSPCAPVMPRHTHQEMRRLIEKVPWFHMLAFLRGHKLHIFARTRATLMA